MFRSLFINKPDKLLETSVIVDVANFINIVNEKNELSKADIALMSQLLTDALQFNTTSQEFVVSDFMYSLFHLYADNGYSVENISDVFYKIVSDTSFTMEKEEFTWKIKLCEIIYSFVNNSNQPQDTVEDQVTNRINLLQSCPDSLLPFIVMRVMLNTYVHSAMFIEWNRNSVKYLIERLSHIPSDMEILIQKFLAYI